MDEKLALETYHLMLRIRRLEEKCAELYSQSKIRGFLHLYIGEEAIAAGLIPQLKKEDAIFATYREHGHALAKGLNMESIMAEMFGKVSGCSRGRGGSMHLFSKEHNFYGGNAIVAGGLPMAVGLALANKKLKKNAMAVCFFGEGAVAEGEFHEAMNLASLWELPVLFVCENNGYAMGVPFDLSEAQHDFVAKANGYKIEAESADGMNPEAVYHVGQKAINYVRNKKKPFFIEYKTYRFRAHSMFDAELYRAKEEVDNWKQKDPLETFRERLMFKGVMNDEIAAELDKRVKEELESAIEFAEKSEREPIDQLETFVYCEGENSK